MLEANGRTRRALLVTVADGPEFLPDAAFAASVLRAGGFETERLATDFCTTADAFQSRVRAAAPCTVVFVDGAEWREIINLLASSAAECGATSIVVVGDSLARETEAGGGRHWSVPIAECPLLTPAFLARLDGTEAATAKSPADVSDVALDYAVFGGGALLRRGMGSSLFADVPVVALLARRGSRADMSPVAALARLEATSGFAGVDLSDEAALAPLGVIGARDWAVEWWDRRFPVGRTSLLRAVADRGLNQSVRLLPADATDIRLAELRAAGVTRVVFDCDMLDETDAPVLPQCAGSAASVAEAVSRARRSGMEAGVLFVVGLPGETLAITRARCQILRTCRSARLRVVPFEPTGLSLATDLCVSRGLWPPADNRWNREIHQPLRQPELGEDLFPAIMEEALELLACVEIGAEVRR